MNHQRHQQLEQWLQQQFPDTPMQLTALAGDASYRRYYRLRHPEQTLIVMDAPPDNENCYPFTHVANLLASNGVCVPEIKAADLQQGFLVLTDFGDQLLSLQLSQTTVDTLYRAAIHTLVTMQTTPPGQLPTFDEDFMQGEWLRTVTWFFEKLLAKPFTPAVAQMMQQSMQFLHREVLLQPTCFIHRDYHSRNLLWYQHNIAVIDFQDAMVGPCTYDLVSLLRDCYVAWPEQAVRDWASLFWQQSQFSYLSETQFMHYFDVTGLQRHIKCIGIFARLFLRDQKRQYLGDIPRVLHYILQVSKPYAELTAFHDYLAEASKQFHELALCEP